MTKTRKDGSGGRLRISYGNAKDATDSVKWLWRFIDAARTPGELYGRALVVIAAEQYATRMMLPASQRTPAIGWRSHDGRAEKALAELAGPHVPASPSAAGRGELQDEPGVRGQPALDRSRRLCRQS